MGSALTNSFHLYPSGWLFVSGLRKVALQHYSLLLESPRSALHRGETSFALPPRVTSVGAGSRTARSQRRSSHPGFGALRLCSLSIYLSHFLCFLAPPLSALGGFFLPCSKPCCFPEGWLPFLACRASSPPGYAEVPQK